MKSEFAFKDIRQRPRGFCKAFMAYAGWIIGLASLLLGIYSGFIKKDEPKLEYDVVSATRLMSVEGNSIKEAQDVGLNK